MNGLPRWAGLRGAGGGSTPSTPTERRNTARSNSVARLLLLLSAGEIGGLATGDGRAIVLDGVPLLDDDGEPNFDGVTWTLRTGTPDQRYIPGFPAVERYLDQNGVAITYSGGPVVRTITDLEVDAVRVTITFPALYHTDDDGNIKAGRVQLAIDTRADSGAWVERVNVWVNEKVTSPWDQDWRVEKPAGVVTSWDYRVRRLTPDSDQAKRQNKTNLASHNEIIDAKLTYRDHAILSLEINGRLFGDRIPSIAIRTLGIKCDVPANYDPVARTYATTGPGTSGGAWDGTFKTAWHSNPVWALWYLETHPEHGLGNVIAPGSVDKWTYYRIAQWCDGMVPDGRGGLEPRFRFDGVLADAVEAHKALNAIAATFRGMTWWGSGAVTLSADMPDDPILIVSPDNVEGGVITYTTLPLSTEHSVAQVTYNDPTDYDKPDIALVESPERIRAIGWKPAQVATYGCRSKAQAIRQGRWLLDDEQHAIEGATWRGGRDQIGLRPGHIVPVMDPEMAGVPYAGRIVARVSATAWRVDRAVTVDPGVSPVMTIVAADGTSDSRAITSSAGPTDLLTIESAWTVEPIVGALWMVETNELKATLHRIVSVTPVKDSTLAVDVAAVRHDPNKWDRIERNLIVEDRPTSLIPKGIILPPANVTVREEIYLEGSLAKLRLVVSWSPSPDSRVARYDVDAWGPDEPIWSARGSAGGFDLAIDDADPGIWNVRVRANDGLGRASKWVEQGPYDASALTQPLPDVAGLRIAILDSAAILSWDPIADVRVDHYRVKFSPATDGATWAAATDLAPIVRGSTVATQAISGTYLIKAVGKTGLAIDSPNPALIVSAIGALEGYNAVETVTENPAWAGAKTSVRLDTDAGGIRLSSDSLMDDWPDVDTVGAWDIGAGGLSDSGIYVFANALDLGSVYTSRVTALMQVEGYSMLSDVDAWPDVDDVEDWDETAPAAWTSTMEVRTTLDDPGGTPTWTAWGPLIAGDYTARAYQWRIVLTTDLPLQGVTPLVTTASVIVDMPDRVASAEDIDCPSGGMDIVYDPPFRVRPALGVTAEQMLEGDQWTISGQSRTGFHIRFFAAGGTPVARTFDWIAKGYGRETT